MGYTQGELALSEFHDDESFFGMMYWKLVAIILTGWLVAMAVSNGWHLLIDWWQVPLTMAFGSFVAGFSAEGGGAVAFPVFTKILGIEPNEARQFSLLIQSVGMSTASFVIVYRKTPFYAFAILPAVAGGAVGQALSFSMGWIISGVHLKWLFSITGAALGAALLLQHHSGVERKDWVDEKTGRPLLFCSGLIGGFLAINIGCGADIIAFILLTLILGSTEKKATPTTVIIMALNSIIGVVIISLTGELSGWAVSAWKTAIPVVIFGAPLGAFMAARAENAVILYALVAFIGIELASTILIVPLQSWVIPVAVAINACMCGIVAWKYCRQNIFRKPPENEQNQDSRHRCNRHGFETDHSRPAALPIVRSSSDTGQK